MRKFSTKTLICAVFLCLGVIVGGGCVIEPVDLTVFVEDEKVKEALDKGVSLANGSDSGLTPGNGEISGLIPGKYYTVVEWDRYGNPPLGDIQFVQSNGMRSRNLTEIGRVSAGRILGLTNPYNYRVKSAQPLTGNVSYSYFSGGSAASAAINEGVITIPPPYGDWLVLTITYPLLPVPTSYFEIVSVPVSPAGSVASIPNSGNIFIPAAAGTIIDYVFFDKTPNILYPLYVLRVAFQDGGGPTPPNPGETVLYITLSFTGDNSPQAGAFITYSQSDTDTNPITITLTNASQYDNPIEWYFDGTSIGSGTSFNLNKQDIRFNIKGEHIITVEATCGGVPYSTAIKVTVTS